MGRIYTPERNYSLPDLDAAANIPADLETFADAADADMGAVFAGTHLPKAYTTAPGGQSFTSASAARVVLSTPGAGRDTNALWSANPDYGFITNRAGFWLVTGSLIWTANSTGTRYLYLLGPSPQPGSTVSGI